MECVIFDKDVTKFNNVVGIGIDIHRFKNIKIDDAYLLCVSYQLTTDKIRIFTPHNYHRMYSGNSSIYNYIVYIHVIGHEVVVINDRKG